MHGTSTLKKFVLSLGLSSLLSIAALAQAAAPAPSSTAGPVATKIGVVNVQEAIVATNEGKKEFDALEKRFTPKQAELKNANDELDNLKKQFQAQSDKLSDDERTTRAKTIETKQKSLQRNYEDAQAEFQQAQQEVVNRIGGKMLNSLEKYAKANGYAVILDVSNPQTPVLWAAQGNIITKELVDAYNTDNPATPPPATAAAPKPAAGATNRPAAPGAAATPKKP
ncbi:MAG TPA: OmpH family outer membrane protein [Candidatus Angelobacter sp.]|jgi:outer membrane protein|nr:OmpH family outer membrane protein [Candidatus Angelobacter sp.]